MNILEECAVSCPYCGESIDILVDLSQGEESYIEDCQVCCRPIDFYITEDLEGELVIKVSDENDV